MWIDVNRVIYENYLKLCYTKSLSESNADQVEYNIIIKKACTQIKAFVMPVLQVIVNFMI